MNRLLLCAALFLVAISARAQVQVALKFQRLQYIAHEPVMATVTITNLAGRDIELHDQDDQHWYGFEVTGDGDRLLGPLVQMPEEPLKIAAGTSVVRKINLTDRFPVGDLGVYHVRANVFFADLNKYFYSHGKVFEVTTARPVWQQTVGTPDDGARTYSLMTNRFPDHTSLYVRVEDKANGLVYATYSLGRVIAFDEPHAEIDRENRLHVLQCDAPRMWSYSVVGLDGKLLKHASYAETRGSPRLRHNPDGTVAVVGGMLDVPVAPTAARAIPKLSDRPANLPPKD
ncbi:MAG TPA: hypothetical protein VHW03_02310 [Chthoniobacterales bacterium]|nr:hypothetical protein [Chthoniobacterales bacterium]